MFMKFLIIWRTFRSLALFDGIYAPENMRKCISNSLTFRGFWRYARFGWCGRFFMLLMLSSPVCYIVLGTEATLIGFSSTCMFQWEEKIRGSGEYGSYLRLLHFGMSLTPRFVL
jgi:hypothetical protein